MSVYFLEEEIHFPNPSLADKDGLLAIGGDLSPEKLLLAYSNGIFPWFDEGSPILWWSADPRMVLIPSEFKRSKSLLQTIRRGIMEVKFDHDFPQVITACSNGISTSLMPSSGPNISGASVPELLNEIHL
jgi:leucyl/phenylalanyl-tRNA--protein transferase